MLSRIEIRNFAIIQSLDLDWSEGMTVITGETGAGKSIVIDALGLALGARADQTVIYSGAKQAEVTAIFELPPRSAAINWLREQDLEEELACILRRVVQEGRSKSFINGRSVTQSQLKALSDLLVDIHGQHAHQSLLKTSEQLNLLDRFAGHFELLHAVRQSAQAIHAIEKRQRVLADEKQARLAKHALLSYQVDELSQANPEQAALDTLEQEHKQAATIQDRLLISEACMQTLAGDNSASVLASLAEVVESIGQLTSMDAGLSNLQETIVQAENLLQEARGELSNYQQSLDSDPEKLHQLDQQLATFHDLARKHRVSLQELPAHYAKLQQELNQLHADESELEQIEQELQSAVADYQANAQKLSQSRKQTASLLQSQISDKIQGLAMEGGRLEIKLCTLENRYNVSGNESVEFLVSANPGQPLQALTKVASGGELSRISLAIAVITAEEQLVPSIIFDEVDVGIGGGTAETVGKLLNQLASTRQVICVTHQPQVAACGDQHLLASKSKQLNATATRVETLDKKAKVEEVARMLGGLVISEKTRSHAREMLARSSR